jgi:pSer/pThr/pTyr-binding forkhead associated (FHA) protein
MKKNVKIEVRDLEGELRLRDLGSTNGVHLLNGQRLVRFEEGYVKPQQSVVIGNKKCTIKNLLEVMGIYTDYSDDLGLTVKIAQTN